MKKHITYYGLHPCLWCVHKAMTEKRTPNLGISYVMFNRAGKTFCLHQLPYIQFVFIVFITQLQPPVHLYQKKNKIPPVRSGISPRIRRCPLGRAPENIPYGMRIMNGIARNDYTALLKDLIIKETSGSVNTIFHYQIIPPTINITRFQITKPK
jgi:hypothetical protein